MVRRCFIDDLYASEDKQELFNDNKTKRWFHSQELLLTRLCLSWPLPMFCSERETLYCRTLFRRMYPLSKVYFDIVENVAELRLFGLMGNLSKLRWACKYVLEQECKDLGAHT